MKIHITKKCFGEVFKDKSIESITANKWVADNEIGSYVLKKCIHIPYTPHSFYIQFIYPHLGICHKDLRSKWYIGKAREEKERDERIKNIPPDLKIIFDNINSGIPVSLEQANAIINYIEGNDEEAKKDYIFFNMKEKKII